MGAWSTEWVSQDVDGARNAQPVYVMNMMTASLPAKAAARRNAPSCGSVQPDLLLMPCTHRLIVSWVAVAAAVAEATAAAAHVLLLLCSLNFSLLHERSAFNRSRTCAPAAAAFSAT